MSWVKEADLPDLPEIFKAISSNGQALELIERLNEGIAFGSSALTRAQEEAIATAVSVANRCRYGALTHGGFFRKHADDSDTASQLLSDHTQADLPPADHAMLDFSVKVTLDPAGLTEQDLEGLREAGFTDDQIVSIVLVTCLFNFMNRIANSLGVAVPAPFARSVGRWLTGPAAEETWLLGPEAGQQPGKISWRGLEKALGDLPKPSPLQVADPETEEGLKDAAPPQAEFKLHEETANAAVAEPESDSTNEPAPKVSPLGDSAIAEKPPVGAATGDEPTSEVSPREGPTEESSSDTGLFQDVHEEEDSAIDSDEDPDTVLEGGLAEAAPKLSLQLDQFMSEVCVVSAKEACTARDLYVAYLRWCDLNQIPPVLQRTFGLGLSEIGFQRRRRNHGKHWWLGLSVATGESRQMAA